jgi:hypothetical protein
VGFTEGLCIQQQAANNWHPQRRDKVRDCCHYRCHISSCLRQFADSHTKVLGRWRGPLSAYALGRPCFATYKVSTRQFSQGTIQKLESYRGMFGFPSKRITLYKKSCESVESSSGSWQLKASNSLGARKPLPSKMTENTSLW